ncbi:MAG: class I SAM-dependent methyltransferase [Hymenobacteraceae bacterium]|nr:class I SAM-dependent methyltransferase [Hymenobacteraceae bacterium]
MREPALLNYILAADETNWRRRGVTHSARWPGLTPTGLPVTPLAGLLPKEGDTVEPFAFGGGGSLPTDLLLLRALVRRVGPAARYLEIGTWRGESAVAVAPLAASVATLNLSSEELRALGLSEAYIKQHGHFSLAFPNITHLFGDSATFDYAALPGGPYDVVFIDGDHHYAAVRTDTARVFAHLVGPHTAVVWHDASRQPGQPRWEVLAGILDGLPAELPGHLYAVSHSLCALYVPTPLPAMLADELPAPGTGFRVTVEPLG